MNGASRWPRLLVIAGLVAMVVGALDPMEGSLVILPGAGVAALGAMLSNSQHRKLLAWSFVLLAIGVGALWGVSAIGGFGGNTGRPVWWGLAILAPYLVGWIMGLVGAIRILREASRASVLSDAG